MISDVLTPNELAVKLGRIVTVEVRKAVERMVVVGSTNEDEDVAIKEARHVQAEEVLAAGPGQLVGVPICVSGVPPAV